MFETDRLPTHIARVVSRLNVVGAEASGDTFLIASYIVEALIKTTAIGICAGIRSASSTNAYAFEYQVVRGEGLGSWEDVVSTAAGHSYAGYVSQDLQPLIAWLTKKRTRAEDEWARKAVDACSRILSVLGADDSVPRTVTVRHLLSQFVQVRNKTKAHGAVGPDFFSQANPWYLEAINSLLLNCPVLDWEWFHLSVRPKKENVRAVRLLGTTPHELLAREADTVRPNCPGIHFRTHERGTLFHCGSLMKTTHECSEFLLPNGNYSDAGEAEFIDYATGKMIRKDVSEYLSPPAALPPSATEGTPLLDVYSNVFGNLPPFPEEYVERRALQGEIRGRLLDKNHPIITLHGRGGVGKTSLALFAAHELAAADPPPFDAIIWLSARDLELRVDGATEVRRGVPNIDAVCRSMNKLFDVSPTCDAFAALLQDPASIRSEGVLLMFDNFETLDDPIGVHRFLDTHTHIPNKVLITSRERAFKADYPIEVGGMEREEARRLLARQSALLGVTGIVTGDVVEDIIDYTDANAYIMRVVLAEIAKERTVIPLKSLVTRRSDLLNAIFERSFNKLSPEGRWLFLTVGSWRSLIPELALLAVLGDRGMDVEAGINECLRLSLLDRHELSGGQFCFAAPELAHVFARKKLDGDPDRLLIQEDLGLLMRLGTLHPGDMRGQIVDESLSRLVGKCLDLAGSVEQGARSESLLVRVAELWPKAWGKLAEFRQRSGSSPDEIGYALRRAVEEMPYDKDAWLARATFAEQQGDEGTYVAALVSAVDAAPDDVDLVREVAYQLCRYMDSRLVDIPRARRGVYLASVRAHMEKVASQLDATGLSRLAWLFLLEGSETGAWKYANQGLAKEPTNRHCSNIVERLTSSRP